MSDTAVVLDDEVKQVLDSAKEAAKSTRSTIYFMLFALFVLGMTYRTTSVPDWLTIRVRRYETAIECWKGVSAAGRQVCADAEKYAIEHITPPGNVTLDKPAPAGKTLDTREAYFEEIRKAIGHLRDKRADLRIVQVPLIGLLIDATDLGLVATAIFAVLYSVLYGNIVREYALYDRIQAKGKYAPV